LVGGPGDGQGKGDLMKVLLKVVAGSHAGTEIGVNSDKFLIGRSESCSLRPKSESVSRKHCIIVLRDNKVLVQDLKSRNGTFVNEKRLPPDKAKVLMSGDKLRVGKLEFEVSIEHGLQAAKRPEVKDMGDAAARTVESSDGSRFEAIDVNSWLDEADQIDRVRKLSDPDTRQFRFDTVEKSPDTDSTDLSSEDSKVVKLGKPEKKTPGKLPASSKKALTDDSREAADNALKKFFSGR
jgi:predicted component of type VI protein secretion system